MASEWIDLESYVARLRQADLIKTVGSVKRAVGLVVESLGGRHGYGPCRVVRAAMQKA